ncbi:MAG TPA: twin-arginine translocation signal domain-containing protein [Verrucomicrobiae bacterium]|jgi:hypothetical protein
MNSEHCELTLSNTVNRRDFLRQTAFGAALAAAGATFSQDAATTTDMPTIQLGAHRVSRLILGSNPMLGYSHSSGLLSRLMMDYFTLENMGSLLDRCLTLGINTWQTSAHEKVAKTLEALRNRGHDIQWIFLANSTHLDDPKALDEVIRRNKPIAVVHHGQVSDRLWREGGIEKAHDFVKHVQDLGVMGGLSSHNPDVIRHAEKQGWKPDFYMTSFHHVSRSRAEVKAQLGEAPMGEVFLPSDPPRMCEAIREVKRPCLAFKILAAGRNCDRPEQVSSSFEFAFRNIKRSDAVIVGMFPQFQDQALEDSKLTVRFSSLSQ